MHLTKKASYGLIAACELARDRSGQPLSAAAIAKRYSLSRSFVEKIMHRLKQAGLVDSRKGRDGGYTLVHEPSKISVRRILEGLDESLDLVGCLGPDSLCTLTDICPTKTAWGRINRGFIELLDSLTLEDLI